MGFCRFCGKEIADTVKGCDCTEALAEAAKEDGTRIEKTAEAKTEDRVEREAATIPTPAAIPQETVKVEQASAIPQETVKVEQAPAIPQETVKVEQAPVIPQETAKVEQASAIPQETVKVEQASAIPQEMPKVEETATAAIPQGKPEDTVQATADTVSKAAEGNTGMPQASAGATVPQGSVSGQQYNYGQGAEQAKRDFQKQAQHNTNAASDFIKKAVENRNFMAEILKLLKSPVIAGGEMIQKNDYVLPGILILTHAVVSACFSLLVGFKIDSVLTKGVFVNPVLSIFITLVLSLILSALYGAVVYGASKIFRINMNIYNVVAIMGLRSLWVIPFVSAAFLFVSLNLVLGLILFYLPLVFSPLLYVNALKTMNPDRDRTAFAELTVSIVFIILFLILARIMFKLYFPGVFNLLSWF